MAKIVLWKLGSLEHRIMPSRQAIEKLADMLRSGLQQKEIEDTMHVIWGPDLTIEVVDVPDGVQHVVQMPNLDEQTWKSPQPAVCPMQ